MADQFQAEKVLNFAFLPIDAVNGIGQREELRFLRRDRDAQNNEAVRRIDRKYVIDMETARRCVLQNSTLRRSVARRSQAPSSVISKHAHQPRLPLAIQMGGEAGDQFHLRVNIDFIVLRMDHLEPTAKAFLQVGDNGKQLRENVHKWSGSADTPAGVMPSRI